MPKCVEPEAGGFLVDRCLVNVYPAQPGAVCPQIPLSHTCHVAWRGAVVSARLVHIQTVVTSPKITISATPAAEVVARCQPAVLLDMLTPGRLVSLAATGHDNGTGIVCQSRVTVHNTRETRDLGQHAPVRLRMRGLEPPRGCPHWHLKPARLPIPPHPLRQILAVVLDSAAHPVMTKAMLRLADVDGGVVLPKCSQTSPRLRP